METSLRPFPPRPKYWHWNLAFAGIGIILLLRIVTLAHLPFLDPSESRYAVVGTVMAGDGDLFTPKVFQDGKLVPFLSKPPLHFWFEAASLKVFGNSELALRLPSFVAALGMLLLVAILGRQTLKKERVIISVIVLFTSILFFHLAGLVLVDMTLSAAITGVMVSFYIACERKPRKWGYLVFVFLAIGMLTKGPVAVVFPVFAVTLWLALTRNWALLKALPWIGGSAVFIALTVPVFLLEECSNPGFLKYFFLNENLLRYFVQDYGDRFGSGHRYPYGSSWFFLFAGFLPWSLLVVPFLIASKEGGRLRDSSLLYFLCWGFAPAIVLTFSRQLLGTYLLPGFGGLSLFIGATYPLDRLSISAMRIRKVFIYGAVCLVLVSVGLAVSSLTTGLSVQHGVVSFGILAILVAMTYSLTRQQGPYQAIVLFGIVLSIAYTSQTLSACIFSKQFMSSFLLFDAIEKRYQLNHPTVYFPFGVPHSAYLYSDQPLVDGGDDFLLPLKDNNSLVVVRDKQTQEFKSRFGTDFRELLRVGKWRVFHKEQHHGSCDRAMLRSHASCSLHPPVRRRENPV